MKQLKRKLSFLLIAVMVLTMNVQFVHATTGDVTTPTTTEENGDTEAEVAQKGTIEEARQRKHKITISGKGKGHKYEAYQVFEGRADKEGKGQEFLSDIGWGNGVNADALLSDLQNNCTTSAIDAETNEPITDYPFGKCNTAKDVADVLAKYSSDDPVVVAFSRIVGKHLVTEITDTQKYYPFEESKPELFTAV